MTCERCGHEHPSEVGHTLEDALLRCIANLRADLTEAREERDQAINDLTAEHELALCGLRADLEAERARSWELAERLEVYLNALQNTARAGTSYLDRAARAEAACTAMRAALERLYQVTVTVDAHNRDAVYGARDALATDAGRK